MKKLGQLWFKFYVHSLEEEKVVRLIMDQGWEGFGIYVGLLVMLRRSPDGTLPTDNNFIGRQLHCPNGKVKAIIMQSGLMTLTQDGKRFFNEVLLAEMQQMQEKLAGRRRAGQASALKRWGTPLVEPVADSVPVSVNPIPVASVTPSVTNATTSVTSSDNRKDKEYTYVVTNSNAPVTSDNASPVADCPSSQSRPLVELMPLLRADFDWHRSLVDLLQQRGIRTDAPGILSYLDQFFSLQCARGMGNEKRSLADAKKWLVHWLLLEIKHQTTKTNEQYIADSKSGQEHSSGRKSHAQQIDDSKRQFLAATQQMLLDGDY